MLISHFYAILGLLGWAVTLYEKHKWFYISLDGEVEKFTSRQQLLAEEGKVFQKKTPFCYRSGTIFALFYSCST